MEKLPKIFVIDDSEIDCLIAKILIEKAFPCTVNSFLSASTALEALQFQAASGVDELPDIILLDLEMPLKNGWDFLDEYQNLIQNSSYKSASIYIITSFINPLDDIKAKNHPLVKDILIKPLTKEMIRILQQ